MATFVRFIILNTVQMKKNYYVQPAIDSIREMVWCVPLCVSTAGGNTESYDVDEEEDW